MYIVRDVLIAKPGLASKLAAMMKEAWPEAKVMTDMTGVFNKVVMEAEYPDLAAFERHLQEYMAGKAGQPKMTGYTEMYSQGKREIYRVW
ncbi:MAG: hypothetical protein HYY50_04615 [Candidatus Kerfeldbacteria bacterium]|nr:hypothetical protein [Candidatus Kerfeldbacteria bacterium]